MSMIVQEKEEKSRMNAPWTTTDELRFVAYLRNVGRISLLEGYLAGLERRVNWGAIDAKETRKAALLALDGLQ